jgi:predicted nucleic acid-binding protein
LPTTGVKRNGRACLDAFAWLAWLQDEPGAAAVQQWLDKAAAARAECVTSVINLGEAYYHLVRVERRDEAESLWCMAVRGTLPVSVKDATRRRVRRAAELKPKHAIALCRRIRLYNCGRVQRDTPHRRPGNRAPRG